MAMMVDRQASLHGFLLTAVGCLAYESEGVMSFWIRPARGGSKPFEVWAGGREGQHSRWQLSLRRKMLPPVQSSPQCKELKVTCQDLCQ